MEGLIFRKANPNEIDLMIKARVDYCMRGNQTVEKQDYDLFYKNLKDWTKKNVSQGSYLSYFGYLFEELVCFAGLLLYELPPIVKQSNRKQGFVLSFFTYPQHRNRGIGNELMKFMIHDAKERGISKLVLIATNDGIPLYRKNGFSEPSMLYLEKKIDG